MRFNRSRHIILPLAAVFVLLTFFSPGLEGYEIFIYRAKQERRSLSLFKSITVNGEYFVQLQSPSTFPSFNDLSGPVGEPRQTAGQSDDKEEEEY